MVKKLKKTEDAAGAEAKTEARAGAQLSGTIKDSAQQIWLAGLGAFAKAQEEGSKVFDALVKEGTNLQRKTQAVAEEKLSEATTRMASVATGISSKASGQWDRLETIFEERVSRALNKLGVPSAADIEALTARIEELESELARLGGEAARSARTRAVAAPAVADEAGEEESGEAAAPAAAPRKRSPRKSAAE